MSDHKPTAQDYADLFEIDRRGAAIFDDLYQRFARKVFVAGGHEADRQTCYNAGARDVIEFITRRINQSRGVDINEEENDGL